MFAFVTRIIGVIFGLLLLAFPALGAQVKEDNYEIYLGDVDGDGDDDFYFQQKPWYLILHGEIATPIQVQNNFAIYNNGGSYSSPVRFSLSAVDLLARVTNGSLKKGVWNQDIFLIAQTNGSNTILIRGAYVSSPALLLKNYTSSPFPTVAATYSTTTFRGISDRNVTLRIIDVNGDDINDVVLGNFGSTDGEVSYLADGNNIHSQQVTISAGVPVSTGTLVGAVEGQFRVDESGSATYSVPISAPQGVAGVSPKIAINYSSQNGNGLVGFGANITGLGGVTRCHQTLLQDGVAKPITTSNEDRFCLDGQRLMVINGEYGAPGSIYKTEIDKFSIITAVGGVSGNPDYFEVQSKDGSIALYGKAAGSKISSIFSTFIWSLSQFEDNMGNRIDYIYEGDSTTGLRVSSINYAYPITKSSASPAAKIKFYYTDRNDTTTSFIHISSAFAGEFSVKQTKRLSEIKTFNTIDSGEVLVKRYAFDYTYSSAGKSRLSTVTECTGEAASSCLNPTSFTWATAANGFYSSPVWFNKLPSADSFKVHKFMDVNGDGKQDLVWVRASGNTRYIEYGYADRFASGNLSKQKFTNNVDSISYFNVADSDPGLKIDNEIKLEVIDYNLDGRQDLLVCKQSTSAQEKNLCVSWDLYLSEPTNDGKWQLSSSKIVLPFREEDARFGDINSDGSLDAYVISDTNVKYYKTLKGSDTSSNTFYYFDSSPIEVPLYSDTYIDFSGTGAKYTAGYNLIVKSSRLGDFDGDGAVDIAVPAVAPPVWTYGGDGQTDTIWKMFIFKARNDKFEFDPKLSFLLSRYGVTCFAIVGICGEDPYITNVQISDINQDGLDDIVLSDTKTDYFSLNKGSAFSPVSIIRENAWEGGINLTDYNRDGYLDIIYHNHTSQRFAYREWSQSQQAFVAATELAGERKKTSSYGFSDISGDGFADLIEIKADSGGGIDLGTYEGFGSSRHNKIYKIVDGMQRVTEIDYGSLANSVNYSTLVGVNTTTVYEDCSYMQTGHFDPNCNQLPTYAFNKNNFYQQINSPFPNSTSAPILELAAPISIVTAVSTSLPTAQDINNLNKVTYHYHHARLQAGGRGFLGFEKITTANTSNGVVTQITYHQNWPFIGLQKSIVVTSKEGKKLSESMFTWSDAVDGSNSRVHRVQQDTTTEISYELKNNGVAQGDSLQTVTTNTDYDTSGYGNVTQLEIVTAGQSNTLTKTTVNTYPADEWQSRMGRLETTTTTTKLNSEPAVTRSSKFEYYDKLESWPGMLKKEIIEPGSNQHVTEYEYDSVGNKVITRKTANVKPGVSQTRKVEVEYDTSKRFVETTKDGLNNVISGVIKRHPVYGVPTQIRDANGVVTIIELNADGSERVRRDASGAGVITARAYCGGSVSCPGHARIRVTSIVSGGGKSTEYLDVLGRVVRSSKVMFDGSESHVDTEYDIQGRISRKSEPYFSNETVYWTVFNEYDLVNRILKATAPDDTETTSSYSGYETLSTMDSGTNGKKLTRKEERNDLGNLVKVTDHAGGTISYNYDPFGNLTSATTTSAGQSVVVRMCYDNLGRKIAMHDPDKGGFLGNPNETCATIESKLDTAPASKTSGWWFYKYNDFGELIEQTDTKKQVSVMAYDALGRMVTRTDKRSDNSVDVHTRWYYDKYLGDANSKPETQLKLTAVVASYNGINESCSGANYCQTHVYDSFSRITDTATYLPNDSTGYITSVRYDVAGRAYKQYDALNGNVQTSGTRTYFNSYGYAQQINDIATGDVLQKTLKLNARGQVKEELRNNGSAGSTVYTYDNATGRLTNQSTNLAGILIPIQNVTYNWDKLGNLKYRWNQSGNVTPSGSTAKKDLRESFCYDGLNRLIKNHLGDLAGSCNLTPAQQDQEYDGFGNITRKVNVGTYSYSGKGPHAVTSVTNATTNSHTGSYGYDNNGNQISGGGRTNIVYSTYDQPLTITSTNATTHFTYGPDRKRFERKDIKNGKTIITNYLGNVERVQESGSSIVEWKRYIAGAIYTVRTINGAVEKTNKSFIFNDHLGSLDVVTDAVGKVTHSASFNAWGERRSGENWAAAFATSSLSLTGFDRSLTQRGYTGHEMLDDHGLIHMNGRIYDPKLARFLQADPFIQAATNTQSYNRYSYVLNNPLNATDPSGHFFMLIAALIIKAVVVDAVVAAFLIGMVASVHAIVNGANIGQAIGIGIVSGLSSGMSSNAFGGYISGLVQGAIVGGISSEVAGGEFKDGAKSGAINGLAGDGTGNVYIDFTVSVVLAGAASEATGGKFKNGAATAATYYVLEVGAAKLAFGGNRADPDRNITLTDPEDGCDLALVSCSMSYSGGGEIEEYTLTADLSLQRDVETASYFTGIAGVWKGMGMAMIKRIPKANSSNYRTLFKQSRPDLPDGYDVHHSIPQRYEELFEAAGINIHQNQFLRGVSSQLHTKITKMWGRFHAQKGNNPTAGDIAEFAKKIDQKYEGNFIWPGF